MKKTIQAILLIWSLSIALVYQGCQEKLPELEKSAALDLITKINSAHIGIRIETNAEAVETQADTKSSKNAPRYYVSLINPVMTFDSSVLKEVDYPLPEFVFTFNCEKLVFHFGPEDSYLGLASVSGLRFELEPSKTFGKVGARKSGGVVKKALFRFYYGDISLDRLNLSPLLESKLNLYDRIIKIASLNQSLKSKLDKIEVEIIAETEMGGARQFKISVGNIISEQETNPDFIKLVFSKSDESQEKILELLKEPSKLFDTSFAAGKISVSVKKEEKEEMGIGLGKGELSQFLIPSAEKGFYKFKIASGIKDFRITSPENKVLEALGQVKQLRMEFSLDRLSPSFLQAYIQLMKRAQSLQAAPSEEAAREMSSLGSQIAGEFLQSKPTISFSLSPLEHDLGKIEAEGQFQVPMTGMLPLGRTTATFYQFKGLEQRLREENILSEEMIRNVMDFLGRYFVQDKKGDGRMVLEIRQEAPFIYLNDKPITHK